MRVFGYSGEVELADPIGVHDELRLGHRIPPVRTAFTFGENSAGGSVSTAARSVAWAGVAGWVMSVMTLTPVSALSRVAETENFGVKGRLLQPVTVIGALAVFAAGSL